MSQSSVAETIGYTVDEKGCWLTERTIGPGYPFFPVSNRPEGMEHYSQYAHRAVLEEKLGRKLLSSELACHTCDVRGCFNPEHVYCGTKRSNMKDALDRVPGVQRIFEENTGTESCTFCFNFCLHGIAYT